MSDSVRIGNVEVVAVADAWAAAPCSVLFPAIQAEAWEPHREHLAGEGHDAIPLAITSFLLRAGGQTMLVDTGIGAKNRGGFPNGCLPEALTRAGVRADDIDVIVTTHIHIDHVGWHTMAKGEAYVPTFPRARYLFNRDEWAHWTAPDVANARGNEYVVDSVLPLEGAADVQLVDSEHRLTDEITLLPTPGHTPAHVSIAIMSAGEVGVILGDVAHNPAQVAETSWSPVFDMNPALAAQTRESLMQRIEDEGMMVLAGHFAHPGFGHLVRIDGRRTWRALD